MIWPFAQKRLTEADLGRLVKRVIRNEEKISKPYEDDPRYGQAGDSVKPAIVYCERAMLGAINKCIQENSLNPMLEAVSASKSRFRDHYDDDAGYGLATFNTVMSALLEQQQKNKERSKYSIDDLV